MILNDRTLNLAGVAGSVAYTASGATTGTSTTPTGPTSTAIALTLSSSTVTAGNTLTLTATVNPNTVPGTIITFYDGSTSIGTATTANGVANFSTTSLSVGSHSLTAVFPSSGLYSASTSNTATVTVSSAAWNPTNLGSALKMWYKVGTNTTSASNRVSAIGPAQSGYGPQLLQATGANQPLLTMTTSTTPIPAVKVDVANVFLQASMSGLGFTDSLPFTMMVGFQVDNANRFSNPPIAIGTAYDSGGGTNFELFAGNSNVYSVAGPATCLGGVNYQAATITSATPEATGVNVFLAVTYDGSKHASGLKMYANGTQLTSVAQSDTYVANAINFATGNLFVGFPRSPGFVDAQDMVTEIMLCNTVLSPSDLTSAATYYTARIS